MKVGLGMLQDEFELSGEFQAFLGWKEKLLSANISVYPFSSQGDRVRASKFFRHQRGEFVLKKCFEQWAFITHAVRLAPKIDILHVFLPTPNFLWISDRIKKRTRKPVVVTCLSEKAEIPGSQSLKLIKESFFFHSVRWLAAHLISEGQFLGDGYIVGSSAVARQLQAAGCPGDKIALITHSLPKESPTDPISLQLAEEMDRQPTFLYLGHFLPNKGVDILLEAFAALSHKEGHLLLAWSGLGDISQVKQKIRDFGIADRVTLVEDLIHRSTLFNHACALVLPFTVTYGQVSPPIILLEAFRAGVPVIISKFPSVLEFGEEGKTVFYFNPDRPQTLIDQMDALLDDLTKSQDMRKKQRTMFTKFYDQVNVQNVYSTFSKEPHG